MGKRYRKWQEGHDERLEERYDRTLPGPLRRMASLYPSQQRQRQRDSGSRERLREPQPQAPPPQGPPAGWYQDPDGTGTQRWWDGQTWTEHRY